MNWDGKWFPTTVVWGCVARGMMPFFAPAMLEKVAYSRGFTTKKLGPSSVVQRVMLFSVQVRSPIEAIVF